MTTSETSKDEYKLKLSKTFELFVLMGEGGGSFVII